MQSLEKCDIYTKSSAWWEPGKSFYGGGTRRVPGEAGEKILRAIDIQTGKIVWEYPQIGPADSWGGVLSTAGGLVFLAMTAARSPRWTPRPASRSGISTPTSLGRPRR